MRTLGNEIAFNVVKFSPQAQKYCIHSEPVQLRTKECSCCGGCGESSNAISALAKEYGIKDVVSLEVLNNQIELSTGKFKNYRR